MRIPSHPFSADKDIWSRLQFLDLISLFRSEKSTVEWEGGKIRLVYGVPSNFSDSSSCMIIAPAASGGMRIPIIRFFHEELAERGVLTVKFGFPGMGFLNSLLRAWVRIPVRKADLFRSYRKVIEKTRSTYGPKKMFVGGMSLGAYVTALLAAQDLQLPVDGLFFLSYPLPPAREENPVYDVSKPMLFIAGTRDPLARRDRLEEVLTKLGSKATVHWVPDGDHLLNPHRGRSAYREALELVASRLIDWSETCH